MMTLRWWLHSRELTVSNILYFQIRKIILPTTLGEDMLVSNLCKWLVNRIKSWHLGVYQYISLCSKTTSIWPVFFKIDWCATLIENRGDEGRKKHPVNSIRKFGNLQQLMQWNRVPSDKQFFTDALKNEKKTCISKMWHTYEVRRYCICW